MGTTTKFTGTQNQAASCSTLSTEVINLFNEVARKSFKDLFVQPLDMFTTAINLQIVGKKSHLLTADAVAFPVLYSAWEATLDEAKFLEINSFNDWISFLRYNQGCWQKSALPNDIKHEVVSYFRKASTLGSKFCRSAFKEYKEFLNQD